MAFCTECGANVADGIKFCTGCGKPMGEASAQPTQAPPPQQPVAVMTPPIQAAQQSPAPAPVYAQPDFNAGAANTAPPKGSRYAAMGTLAYIGTFILFAIPIVGLIFCIKWAFGKNGNINRRNLSRAYLIFTVIAIVLTIIGFILISSLLNNLWDYLRDITEGQFGGWGDLFDQFKDIQNNIPSGLPGQ
jgi:hypothetical protein